jgi:hypothetical protein
MDNRCKHLEWIQLAHAKGSTEDDKECLDSTKDGEYLVYLCDNYRLKNSVLWNELVNCFCGYQCFV